MYIKHSKFKNTGILFEILVKKITGDTLSGKTSPAIKIIKDYFVNTELGKEYKLYETLFKSKKLDENTANVILTTVLEQSKRLNRTRLKNEKYNLIKELKQHYPIEDLWRTKLYDYKARASFYTLLEIYNTQKAIDPTQIVENKLTVLEHLTYAGKVDEKKITNDVIEEFKSQPKDLRTLTYHIILENFNSKYDNLNTKQKLVLKQFIKSADNTTELKEFYNSEIKSIKNILKSETKKVSDKATQIKLVEIDKLIQELNKRTTIKNDHLVDLLQYHSLIEELTEANG